VKHTPAFTKEVQYAERLKKGLSLMLYVSAEPYGTKTWRVLFYDGGKPRAKRLGAFPELSVENARKAAFEFDPDRAIASAKAGTFEIVANEWYADEVLKRDLTSKHEIKRHLDVYVLPKWAKTAIYDINGDHVLKLLSSIEKKHGAPQADAVLSTIRGITTWYASYHPRTYTSPVVAKMKRDKRTAKEKARKRVLNDDEIRAVWTACSELGTFGALVKVLLLSGQRRQKVMTIKWADLKNGVWTISAQNKREKGHAGVIRLPKMAVTVIDAQPRLPGNPYVFPADKGNGKSFNSFSQRKNELDAMLPKHMRTEEGKWVLHDLRRTAKTRMSKIKVDRLHSELALGHEIKGVEGTYDRHDYFEEMSAALDRLAAHISEVLNPSPSSGNVIPLYQQPGGARSL
jgi:integrase